MPGYSRKPGGRYSRPGYVTGRKSYGFRLKGPVSGEVIEIAARAAARIRPELTARQRKRAAVVIAADMQPETPGLGGRDLHRTRLAVTRVLGSVSQRAQGQRSRLQ